MMVFPNSEVLVQTAGVVQLLLAAASLAIPRVLHWRQDTAKLPLLTRQVFWTDAAYIWITNVCMGLVSLLMAQRLIAIYYVSIAVNGYMTLYWGTRLLLQCFCFAPASSTPTPHKRLLRFAEGLLLLLFFFLTWVYGGMLWYQLRYVIRLFS